MTRGDAVTAAAVTLGLAAWNNGLGATDWHSRRYVPANSAAAAGLLLLARARGITPAELGTELSRVPAGLRLGGALAAVVAGGIAAAVAVPGLRRLLADERITELSGREVAHHVALRVPVGTALWEEVAFRAVLPAVLGRLLPRRRAEQAAAVVFGLWHVRPALEAARADGVRAPRRLAGSTAAAVVSTSLAGWFLTALHRRSGSVTAPLVVHAASNALGTLAVAAADRLAHR